MWTINYLKDNPPSPGSNGGNANMEKEYIFDYPRPKSWLKIKESLENA
jgi:hypothetical protein